MGEIHLRAPASTRVPEDKSGRDSTVGEGGPSPSGSGNPGIVFKAELDSKEAELQERYPTGFRMSAEFTNSALLDEKALLDLANKPDRSKAEEAILALAKRRAFWKNVSDLLGMPSALSKSLAMRELREAAGKRAGDRDFVNVWDRFLAREYGPIRIAA